MSMAGFRPPENARQIPSFAELLSTCSIPQDQPPPSLASPMLVIPRFSPLYGPVCSALNMYVSAKAIHQSEVTMAQAKMAQMKMARETAGQRIAQTEPRLGLVNTLYSRGRIKHRYTELDPGPLSEMAPISPMEWNPHSNQLSQPRPVLGLKRLHEYSISVPQKLETKVLPTKELLARNLHASRSVSPQTKVLESCVPTLSRLDNSVFQSRPRPHERRSMFDFHHYGSEGILGPDHQLKRKKKLRKHKAHQKCEDHGSLSFTVNPIEVSSHHVPSSDMNCHFLNKDLSLRNNTQCSQCGSTKTPEWRSGPLGGRTLCNACGLFFTKLSKRMGSEAAGRFLAERKKIGNPLDRRISIG